MDEAVRNAVHTYQLIAQENSKKIPTIRISRAAYVHIKMVSQRSGIPISKLASRAIIELCKEEDKNGMENDLAADDVEIDWDCELTL